MFVSRGIGTVYVPIRINCPPEVAVLTLQPATPPDEPSSLDRPAAAEHKSDGLGIDAMLLDKDPRRQRLD